jgi:hypothetical protein
LREEPLEKITLADAKRAEEAAVQQEPQNSLQHVEHATVLPPYGYPNAYYGEPMQMALEEPPAKRPKSYNILSEHEKKKILFYCFSDGSAPSLRSYCQTQNIPDPVRKQLQHLINKHPVLKDMQDKIGEMAVRNDAMSYINMNLPGPSVLPKAQAKKDFFTVNNIHGIATSLDFEEEPRMRRNGKKEIPIHVKHKMDERTRSLAMIMIQMVIANTPKITSATEEQVYEDAVTITMYDQGYRCGGRGVSQFRRIWLKRVIDYFKEGVADHQAPLEGCVKKRNLKG